MKDDPSQISVLNKKIISNFCPLCCRKSRFYDTFEIINISLYIPITNQFVLHFVSEHMRHEAAFLLHI